jgi:hypothetical protein
LPTSKAFERYYRLNGFKRSWVRIPPARLKVLGVSGFVGSPFQIATVVSSAKDYARPMRVNIRVADGKITRWARLAVRYCAKTEKRALSWTVSPYPSSVAPSFNQEPTFGDHRLPIALQETLGAPRSLASTRQPPDPNVRIPAFTSTRHFFY